MSLPHPRFVGVYPSLRSQGLDLLRLCGLDPAGKPLTTHAKAGVNRSRDRVALDYRHIRGIFDAIQSPNVPFIFILADHGQYRADSRTVVQHTISNRPINKTDAQDRHSTHRHTTISPLITSPHLDQFR